MAIALGCSSMMTSCTDYLTIYPTNSVILENYWKTAEDVNGMLATCYNSLADAEVIKRIMVWGELRADNIVPRSGASNDLKYIVEANLLETNGYFKWEHFYKTINYCNMLIQYAPGVIEEDPDFTQGDLDVILGEAYALRALCHFTLVRSFRDIPMSFIAMDADEQEMIYPQYSAYEALDSVKADLDRAAALCMKTGGWSEERRNYARVTKNAVYAMMADVNLWRASFAQYSILAGDTLAQNYNGGYTPADVNDYYTQVIENCDSVLAAMKRQVIKEYDDMNKSMTGLDTLNNPYFLGVNNPLMKTYPTTYDEIFCNMTFSREGYMTPNEVIFKLDFNTTNYNSAVNDFYGYSKTTGSYLVPSKAPITVDLYEDSDQRLYSFTSVVKGNKDDKAEYTITKYAIQSALRESNAPDWYPEGKNESDWIFYRKTDVLLMKATALAYRYANGDAAVANSDHNLAFHIVQSVNKRNLTNERDSLKPDEWKTQELLKTLVLEERLRELSFEGKRWYDLVQKALCENTTKNILDLVIKKLDSNTGAVQSKMSSINSLFCPIYESELKLNPLLKQNPAFERNSSIEQN